MTAVINKKQTRRTHYPRVVKYLSDSKKIDEIIFFVTKHPHTIASRRICREILGEAIDRFNEEFAMELETGLKRQNETNLNSYYCLIR